MLWPVAALLLVAHLHAVSDITGAGSLESAAVLSQASPTVEFVLPQPPQGALLKVAVTQVRNPTLAAVSLRVSLQDAERREPSEEVLRFALFPSDQPGAAIARPDQALLRLRRAGSSGARVIVRVSFDFAPDAAARVPPPVELRLEAMWVEPSGAPAR